MKILLINLLISLLLFQFIPADAYQDLNQNESVNPNVSVVSVDSEIVDEDKTFNDIIAEYSGIGAQSVSTEVIDSIQENKENLFPISIFKNYFTKQVDAVLTTAGENSIMRIITEYGQQDIDLFVNADFRNDHIGEIFFDGEYLKNFVISADVVVRDVFPVSGGGCYLGFTDKGMTGNSDSIDYLFVFDGTDGMLYVKNTSDNAGTKISLSSLPEEPVTFMLIHLTEHIFMFVNDTCIGQFHDGKSGKVRMFYGAMTFSDGDTASCSFDNLVIRKLGNE